MQNNDETEQECGLYPWFEEHGVELIHPEDISRFTSLVPYGKVFSIGREINGMFELIYGSEIYRVKPELLKKIPASRYRVGDQVVIIGKTGTAEITEVMWHHKEQRPFYQITLEGKKKSNRYWESDLQPIDSRHD